MPFRRLLSVALLSLVPALAGSQQFATVTGVAVDSVRGGFLSEALISVGGTSRTVVTDSAGRFRIDSIPPGSHSLRMVHPFLDTLGLTVTTRPYAFASAENLSFVLSVPSPATIVATRCSVADRARGAGALAGVVLDANTEMPVAGAEVVVAWMDYQIGSKTISKTPHRRTANVAVDGSYLVCGIPVDLTTGVVATVGTKSTAAVPVDFSTIVAIQNFFLPETDNSAADVPRERATLFGTVVDANGKAVEGARVATDGDDTFASSSSNGAFSLAGLQPGTRAVSVRKIGFEPVELAVALSTRAPHRLDVQLKAPVRVLETVRVSAIRDLGLQRVGFTDRKRMGMGNYITPQMIASRGAPRLNYLLENNVRLRTIFSSNGKRYVVAPPGNCLQYYVDGHRWSPLGGVEEAPDAYLSGAELGAIEIYDKFFAPPEFNNGCYVVVVWTKWKLKL